MYKVTAYFKDYKITQKFYDLYDAIDFRDTADAHYPKSVTFEKVKDMREMIVDSWNSVMNAEMNPLRHIPDLNTRHMVLQVLAWMWCLVFAFIVGSWTAFGVSAIAHVVLLAAICITVGTFETAKRNPDFFQKFPTSTPSRARTLWINGKRVSDPYGGEHE